MQTFIMTQVLTGRWSGASGMIVVRASDPVHAWDALKKQHPRVYEQAQCENGTWRELPDNTAAYVEIED